MADVACESAGGNREHLTVSLERGKDDENTRETHDSNNDIADSTTLYW